MSLGVGDPEVVGEYRLLDRLGSGGMGVVYLARAASGRQVAVKVVHSQFAEDEEFRDRFRQEVAAARRVSGAYTVPVVDADPDAERPWMATLYVPGRTLAEELAERGPLSAARLRRLALGLAGALGDIHRVGVVHRDLKPANVLMAKDGPRVIDFGVSRAADGQALTVTGRVLGTPPFMSPEQLNRPHEVTAASDVFSLGTLLAFAATGYGPFDADSPYLTAYRVVHEPPALAELAQPLRDVVARCLAKDPARRPELPELVEAFTGLPARGPVRVAARGATAGVVTSGVAAGGAPGRAAGGAVSAVAAGSAAVRAGGAVGAAAGAGRARRDGAAGDTAGSPAGGLASGAAAGGAAAGGAGGRAGALLRWPRGRWPRRVLGSLASLTALGLGCGAFLLFGPDDGVRTSGPVGRGVRAAALPDGWRPWEVALHPSGVTPKAGPAGTAGLGEVFDPQCVARQTRLFCGGMGFPTVRLDARSGRLDWRTGALSDPEEMASGSQPIGVRGGLVFVHDAPSEGRTRLVALDAESGEEVWSRQVSDSAEAAIAGDLVLSSAPGDGAITARHSATGEVRWSYPVPPGQECSPAGHAGLPYALCWADDGESETTLVRRLDRASGAATELAHLRNVDEPLGTDGGDLLFLRYQDRDGAPYQSLVRLDAVTGKRREVRMPRLALGHGSLAGGRLFFVQSSGRVTAVDPRSGRTLWSSLSDVERLGLPSVSTREHTVYLCNGSGRVLALDLRDGGERWQTGPRSADSGFGMSMETSAVLRVDGALVASASDGTLFSVDPNSPDPGR
ncbi:protein kinase domain-containing protein [Streptomyces buecherae]|uniref:protein kinase domain-containing protein n=1 Tax=Streptomyces buecherae TaxID=2763006 RepID=UPI003657D85B